MVTTNELSTEIILSHLQELLGEIRLDWTPQPGNHLELNGISYLVLERHHQYQYKIGGYYLHKIRLYVQVNDSNLEKNILNGHWIIGDYSCLYNAQSELLRCTVNPLGPCQGCRDYELR